MDASKVKHKENTKFDNTDKGHWRMMHVVAHKAKKIEINKKMIYDKVIHVLIQNITNYLE